MRYDRNRIRNLEEKISELEPDGQVVKGITDYFCQTKISRLQGELEEEKERVRVFSYRILLDFLPLIMTSSVMS